MQWGLFHPPCICTEQGVAVVRESQQVARQCLVVAVNWKNERAGHKGTTEEASL